MPSSQTPAPLKAEINQLGKQLGDTIVMLSGEGAFDAVEKIRALSGDRRGGDPAAESRLRAMIAELDDETLRVVIRAYTVFLDLANLAEDRQRLRVLKRRSSEQEACSKSESIRGAILRLKEEGATAEEVQDLIDGLSIELVFTAHPTEAKRRSVRSKLRSIRNALPNLDDESDTALAACDAEVRCEMAKLWMTDFIRPWRPTVLQEVRRGLSVKSVLWEAVPDIMQEIRDALSDAYPEAAFRIKPCIRYGSWIGGDRDGHPYVTTEVTAQTFDWLHDAAIDFHDSASRQLWQSLSLSSRQIAIPETLQSAIDSAVEKFPEVEAALVEIPPGEKYRRWLAIIRWRLLRSTSDAISAGQAEGCYGCSEDLETDVRLLRESLRDDAVGKLLRAEVQRWLDQVRCFGLYMAQLDVRQDSQNYAVALNEVLRQAGFAEAPDQLNEQERQEVLVKTMLTPTEVDRTQLSEETVEVLDLFDLLVSTTRSFGAEALGSHVISMTRTASDVLTVLWFWQHAWSVQTEDWQTHAPALSIAPLFETVTDLKNAPDIMHQLLNQPAYREHLTQQGDRQIVMLGYSDSTKDGGYLSACWSLFQAQVRINDIARQENIELVFFHGRGGSLGRGGGPAARSILSLPSKTFRGALRLTEQGEVLAQRYDDPSIGRRHLEQLLWSSILASRASGSFTVEDAWAKLMDQWAESSLKRYRQLVESDGFVTFFRSATPVSEIEQLPIGSRPSRRRGGNSLSDLRAIPWVFSWTQARCLVPAWYGIGAILDLIESDSQHTETLKQMYAQWPFFKATIDNAELALAKTDINIFNLYSELAPENEAIQSIGGMISQEFRSACDAILAITDQKELMDGTPWLQESIRVRNRYVDPLNMIQVELLQRTFSLESDETSAEAQELRHLSRLTVNGIAAGLRTSG